MPRSEAILKHEFMKCYELKVHKRYKDDEFCQNSKLSDKKNLTAIEGYRAINQDFA